MNNQVKTYEDLLLEKQKLEALLAAQRELIRCDVRDIKNSLQPAIQTASVVGKFATRNYSNPIMGVAANSIIDVVVKRFALGRAGWFKRLVIPFVLKNLSSHYIANHQKDIKEKLFSLVRRKNGTHQKIAEDIDLSEN